MKTTKIKPVRAWALHINNEPRLANMFYTKKDGILHGWRAEDLVEVEIRPVQQCDFTPDPTKLYPAHPVAHDKAETGEMECAAFKRMMSEGSSDIMSKIIASGNKSMDHDFEIWWKQKWSLADEPSAAEVYGILKKCTINSIRNRKVLEDKIEALEEKLFLKEECRRNEQSQLMKKNVELEAEVARLKGKLYSAREVIEFDLQRGEQRKPLINSFLSSLNEADKTKENG